MSLEQPENSNLSVEQVYREIMKRAPEHDFDPSLDRMRYVLDLLGHPEKSFKTIHITGTNGKGSTARMSEALVRAYGLRTGLYTSPHLEKVNERIAIDGQQISDERFVDLYEQVIDFINLADKHSLDNGGPRMSFFEVLTTMAIWAFADAPVDVAIVEVGMGGLWDATNVIDADAAIIGPVGMDHMQWLGNTVEEIATEKAGIIKAGSTVIVGPQDHESVQKILADKAHSEPGTTLLRDGEELTVLSRVPAVGGQMATLQTPNGRYEDVPISMFGEHQAHNALAALAAAEVVIPVTGTLDGDLVGEALGGVKVPGRIEVIRTSPTTIIDGGHNVQAVTALRKAIEESFDFQQLVGVVSMMGDKQVEAVLGILEPLLSQIVVTQNSDTGRVMPVDELEKVAKSVFGEDRVFAEPSMPDAIAKAVDLVDTDDELGVGYGHGVLITGSFVTAGDARILLKETPNKDLLKKKSER
ncbi:MAG: bifunctional folylpolyglutamate synthase/dihydrofolate synthase [Bifidobacteriaceae bacterium]|nr:bifunctional folylpolyglutamate synthase/dihydrofolate synthase [Bifidobacteriaceae bacterium]